MRMTFSAVDEPNLGPQLRRQPSQVVRHVHRLDPAGRDMALAILDRAQMDYRHIKQSLAPHEAGMLQRAEWQARAELFRRIASHQKIID